jgi:hypothetical protein
MEGERRRAMLHVVAIPSTALRASSISAVSCLRFPRGVPSRAFSPARPAEAGNSRQSSVVNKSRNSRRSSVFSRQQKQEQSSVVSLQSSAKADSSIGRLAMRGVQQAPSTALRAGPFDCAQGRFCGTQETCESGESRRYTCPGDNVSKIEHPVNHHYDNVLSSSSIGLSASK